MIFNSPSNHHNFKINQVYRLFGSPFLSFSLVLYTVSVIHGDIEDYVDIDPRYCDDIPNTPYITISKGKGNRLHYCICVPCSDMHVRFFR